MVRGSQLGEDKGSIVQAVDRQESPAKGVARCKRRGSMGSMGMDNLQGIGSSYLGGSRDARV